MEQSEKHLGDTFHELAKRKGAVIEEGHLMKDHGNYSAGVKIFGSMPFNNRVKAVDALTPCFLQLER